MSDARVHDSEPNRPKPASLPKSPPRRIETQIHRRNKAKKQFPLQAEWDAASGEAPQGLRTPQDRMRKQTPHT
ncbi:MAG: hypothetical protein KGO52_06960 [Nitrospirota bacterium]|nr:hypothetical protein [Nitrospirota bacterium]MDE3224959.1 hypothetical protein [Nitrospirota bacterium]MDE3242443.1 hypothetical protein [Nitrospirota bacterium]